MEEPPVSDRTSRPVTERGTERVIDTPLSVDTDGEIPSNQIKIGVELGQGQFGSVYRGTWNGLDVALKTLQVADVKQFLQEMNLMKRMNHGNIVRFYGVSAPINSIQYIVTEFCEGGDLRNVLIENSDGISVSELTSMALNIATGMTYLHNAQIVHRDLATRNVLVVYQGKSASYYCKVADFGMSRKIDNYYDAKGATQVPIRWTAPEVLKHQKYSTASDVWSFGVVLWEMLEFGTLPYTNMDNKEVIQQVLAGYRLPRPTNCNDELWEIMLICFLAKEKERPSFKEISERLQVICESETIESVHVEGKSNKKVSPNTADYVLTGAEVGTKNPSPYSVMNSERRV